MSNSVAPKKLRVLVLAEACNPEWTSVPLVGFNVVESLASLPNIEVTVATHVRNQPALQNHDITRKAEVVFIDNEWIAKPAYQFGKVLRGGGALGWTTNMAASWPAYIAFEKSVYRQFEVRLKRGEFDLIHRVTPVSPTMPSPLASLTDVPMIIGPLNGGLPWPKEFPGLARSEREWLSRFRKMYQSMPYWKSTYRNAAAVICGSRHTAAEIPRTFGGQAFYMPENGLSPAQFPLAEGWCAPQTEFGFVTVGRLVPYKCTNLTISAMANSPILRHCTLDIVGDGPERSRLQAQVEDCGLAGRVRFHGHLKQIDASAILRKRQAFVFPSVREFGGGVVLEAMASGLPSVVVDYGGPAELVDDKTGILLPMASPDQLVNSVQKAMEQLATNSRLARTLAENALHKVRRRFTWNQKAKQTESIYRVVVPSSVSQASQLLRAPELISA